MHSCWLFMPCDSEVQICSPHPHPSLPWEPLGGDGNHDLRQKKLIMIMESRNFPNSTKKNVHLCFTWVRNKYSLLGPPMCNLFTTLPVHCGQFILWIWDRLLWEVTSPCVENSHKLCRKFNTIPCGVIFHPQSIDGKIKSCEETKNARNVGMPLSGRDSSLNTENKVKPCKYL